jgi:uncharacterized protein (TIGR02452 family)
MNRQQRAQMGQETLTILEGGSYWASNGSLVSIGDALAASVAGAVLYRPVDYQSLLKAVEAHPAPGETTITVSSGTTLEAGQALVGKYKNVVCLNFASAKNPGGGFLSGSQAQEESLARASGLYATQQAQFAFYEHHRRGHSCLYSDHIIYSPSVPVFRDDAGTLLAQPWQCQFLTAAAVNAGAVRQNEPERERQIIPVMEQRTRMVVAAAIAHGCQALVLGAWGCGVFKNDPVVVAGIFAKILGETPFAGQFRHIDFAVYDPSGAGATLAAFKEQFAN